MKFINFFTRVFFLQVVRGAELVDEPLGSLRLLHDALLVILPQRSRQLVVVHRRPVFPLAPQVRHPDRVDDLEDALVAVHPVDAAGVKVWLVQELLHELPKVDVGRGRSVGGRRGLWVGRGRRESDGRQGGVRV